MPKVTMLETTSGSPDGIRVNSYKQGETVDLPAALAKAFVDEMKVAEYVSIGRRDPAPAAKMAKGAPENKEATVVVETHEDVQEDEGPIIHTAPAKRKRINEGA
jgi:hypothetical protein